MVAASLKSLCAYALLTVSFAPKIRANIEEVRDILFELERNATLQQELFPAFGIEDARNEGPEKVNTNPLAYVNLFKRAGCTFYRSGDPRTCITAGDICCTDPNAAQDGWCCPNTDGCGPGTGTLGKCTYRVSWTTTTMWYTSYTTGYETFTSSIGGTTEWTTLTYTDWTTVSEDADTSTEWVTVTSTSAQAGKRGVLLEHTSTPDVIYNSDALPSSTLSMPTATSAAEKQERIEVRQPEVTEAPKYIQIRNILIPRQTMRTDTSERTDYETTYITTTIETTVYRTSTEFSTDWITTVATRTAALNAKTTVTSTTTLYLRPGETAPASPQETDTNLSGGGSSGGRRKGLTGGARAGIGVGVSLGAALLAALVGFFIRRHKSKKNDTSAGAAAVAPGAPPMQQQGDFKAPMHSTSPMGPPGVMAGAMSPPMTGSDPRYSQMTQTTPGQYGTPSPGPVYNYPQQGYAAAPMPMGSPPPGQQYPQQGVAPMGGSPPPQQYPQQGQYQYPRPPSPTHGGSGPGSPTGMGMGGMQQPMPMQPGMQAGQMPPSEMPAVYSPQPQRPQ